MGMNNPFLGSSENCKSAEPLSWFQLSFCTLPLTRGEKGLVYLSGISSTQQRAGITANQCFHALIMAVVYNA